MARWRLLSAHYLNVPDTEWEYAEAGLGKGGKKLRKLFPVPRHLDPNEPSDWNYPNEGVIVVCYEGRGEPADLVFAGDPTPEMEPLDDEAKQISATFAKQWDQAPRIPDQDYSQSLITNIQDKVTSMFEQRLAQPQQVVIVDSPELSKLKDENAMLKAELAALRVGAEPRIARR